MMEKEMVEGFKDEGMEVLMMGKIKKNEVEMI